MGLTFQLYIRMHHDSVFFLVSTHTLFVRATSCNGQQNGHQDCSRSHVPSVPCVLVWKTDSSCRLGLVSCSPMLLVGNWFANCGSIVYSWAQGQPSTLALARETLWQACLELLAKVSPYLGQNSGKRLPLSLDVIVLVWGLVWLQPAGSQTEQESHTGWKTESRTQNSGQPALKPVPTQDIQYLSQSISFMLKPVWVGSQNIRMIHLIPILFLVIH